VVSYYEEQNAFTFKSGSIRDSDDFLFLKFSDDVEVFSLAGFKVVHGMRWGQEFYLLVF